MDKQLDKELLIKDIKSKIKYFTKQIKERTQNAEDTIKYNDIVKFFEGQNYAYEDMLYMISGEAPISK